MRLRCALVKIVIEVRDPSQIADEVVVPDVILVVDARKIKRVWNERDADQTVHSYRPSLIYEIDSQLSVFPAIECCFEDQSRGDVSDSAKRADFMSQTIFNGFPLFYEFRPVYFHCL